MSLPGPSPAESAPESGTGSVGPPEHLPVLSQATTLLSREAICLTLPSGSPSRRRFATSNCNWISKKIQIQPAGT